MKQQFEIRRILAVKVAVSAILLSIAQLASAQAFDYEKEKATDFYKFYDNGILCKAKKTFKNAILNVDLDGETKLTYSNGDVVDFTNKINRYSKKIYLSYYNDDAYTSRQDNRIAEWVSEEAPINDWYKQIMVLETVEPIYNKLILGVHNPGITMAAEDGSTITTNGSTFKQVMKNGDYIENWASLADYEYVPPTGFNRDRDNECEIKAFKKDFGDYKVVYNGENKKIIYNNGAVFSGTLHFIPDSASYLEEGPYIYKIYKYDNYNDPKAKSLGENVIRMLKQDGYAEGYYVSNDKYLYCSPLLVGNIAKVVPWNGNTVDAKGKVLDIYEKGKPLDDFDKMSVLASEQAKIDKEKKAAADAIAQKEMIYKKYGKLSADALYNGEVVVGMSEQLFIIGANNYVFKKFSIVNKSIVNSDSCCYDLYNLNSNFSLVSVGYIWARDGKISSIHYY